MVAEQAVLEHAHLQRPVPVVGELAHPDGAGEAPVIARILARGQAAAQEVHLAARVEKVEAVDVGHAQNFFIGEASVGRGLYPGDDRFFPLEKLEEFLDGQKFAILAGDGHHGHRAAGAIPDRAFAAEIGAAVSLAGSFALGGDEDGRFARDFDVGGRVAAIQLAQEFFFETHRTVPPFAQDYGHNRYFI